MAENRLRGTLGDGEALRFETGLRRGGRLGVTDERVILVREDEIESIPFENVDEVTITEYDWFLVVLSVALAGVGLYGAIVVGDVVLGSVFVVAAVVNLLLTYRKRGRIGLQLHAGDKPIVTYVDDIAAVSDALERALDAFRANRERRDDSRG